MKAPRSSAGFTLIEVVLAMGVLVLGMTMLISLFTFGAALSRTAELRTAAASAIDAVMADLEETLFPIDEETGEVGEPEPIVERPVPGSPGVVYSAEPVPNPDEPREYRVEIVMTWKSSGVRRARTFETLMLREIPFGERMRRRFVERTLR